MTRQGRKIDPCALPFDHGQGGDVAPLLSIFADNVQIYGRDTESTPPTYIAKTLIERGAIAFLRDAGQWAAFNSVGRKDRFGIPKRIAVIREGGRITAPMDVDGGRVCVVPAAPFFNVPALNVARRVETLRFISDAIAQNIDALRQIACIKYSNENMAESIAQAERDRQAGKSTTKIYSPMGEAVEIINFAPAAQSFIPDLLSLYTQTLEELDAAVGRTNVGEKQERRISDEMTVIENAAYSSIDVLIDTFNRFCAWYSIDAYAVRGSALNRIKTPIKPQDGAGEEIPDGDGEGGLNG